MNDDSQMFEGAESNVVDIGGGRADASIRQNLKDAIKSKGYISKPLFYQGPGWEFVSKGSSQTKDECDILQRDAQLIARVMYGNGDSRQRLVIELGPGFASYEKKKFDSNKSQGLQKNEDPLSGFTRTFMQRFIHSCGHQWAAPQGDHSFAEPAMAEYSMLWYLGELL